MTRVTDHLSYVTIDERCGPGYTVTKVPVPVRGEIMKNLVNSAIRDEKGGALILALVLLLVGGLIIGPLLGFMGTGINAGEVHEKRMDELYAADAGVEEAIWQIDKDPSGSVEPMTVNGRAVEVEFEMLACRQYRISSTAATPGVSSTTVDVDLYGFSFPDNAITSRFDVDLGNNSYVEGPIQYGRDFTTSPNAYYDPENTVKEEYVNWPSGAMLYDYYYPKYVEGRYFEDCYDSICTIDAKDTPDIGPLYAHNNLVFKSTENKEHRELRLTDTIYVAKDLTIGETEQDFTLNLDDQTIFCEGDIHVGGKVDIIGSGNIIAKGSIYFEPNFTSKDGYILLLALEGDINFQPTGDFTGFVMSADGMVDFQPGGIFTGSIAGDVHVDLSSNVHVVYKSALDALIDFPFETFANWRIQSYNIDLETLD